MYKPKFNNLIMSMAAAMVLVACGGGGGDNDLEKSASTSEPTTENAGTATPVAGTVVNDSKAAVNGGVASLLVADGTTPLTSASMKPLSPTEANAGGFGGVNRAILPDTTPDPHPVKAGPALKANTKAKDPRSNRTEGIRPGKDAETITPVPADKLAKRPPEVIKAKAAGDPVGAGTTVAVAPVPTTIEATASTKGQWSQVYNWPLIPIHMAQMPDGRIMSYGTTEGGRQTGKTIYSMFDPKQGLFDGHVIFQKDTLSDIFCSAQIFLPITNQLITIGGDNLQADGFTNNTGNNSSNIYTPSTNTMVAGKNMALPRWYATTTTLANGTTFIQGGLGGEAYPELRQANGNFKALTTANTTNIDYWYPRNFLHKNGKIFGYDSYGNYYWITTTGTGAIQIVDQWDVDSFGEAGSAVVYGPGKILQLSAFTNKAAIIDYSGAAPTITQTTPMEQRRQNVSGVVLPNGKVLATGGSVVYNEIGTAAGNYFKASTWDPATGAWTQSNATPSGIARLYHSIAMLQPDGTVLVGGGGAWGPLSNNNVEFYYPSYLFNADGTMATKPKVTDAPLEMNIGGTLKLTVDDTGAPITGVSMVKLAATTHSLDMDQGFNKLTFTRAGNVITATLPTEVAYATPGYYHIFTTTANGTPSQARVVRMNVPNAAIDAPTGLTGTAVTAGITLNWTNPTTSAAANNIIERSTSATGLFTPIQSVTVRTTFTDTTATANGTYYYQVKAVNASGNPSIASNVVTVVKGTVTPPVDPNPPTLVVPTAPTGLTATYATASGVTINWTNPAATTTMPAANGNTISRSTTAGGTYTNVATIAAGNTYVDPLQTAGTYFYRVIATNSVGAGPAATSAGVTIAAQPVGTVAVAPTGLSGYTCGAGCWTTDTGVRFNWTPSTTAGQTSQVVERAAALAGPYTSVATPAAGINVYVDKNVTSGTTYFYRVRGVVGTTQGTNATLGYGIQSNITLGTGTPPVTTPVADANIVPSTTAPVVGTAFTVSGTTSTAGTGATIAGYQWTITTGANLATIANATTATATITPTGAGNIVVSLLVTNNQGGTNTETRALTITAAPVAGNFSIESQGETKYLVMNWWRGNPATEGDFRDPTAPGGMCTGPQTSGGNCTLGARKTFRPMAFNIATTPATVAGLIMMDVPQFEGGVKSYDHYRLPVYFVKDAGCSFSVKHVRTTAAGQAGNLEFPLNPPGLEILAHKFNLSAALCSSYPTGAMTQAYLNTLNTALTTYLGAKVAYAPIAYPYSDPRTGKDPSTP